MKFRLNISKGYQIIERTRFCDGQTDGQKHRLTDRWTQGEKYVSRPHNGLLSLDTLKKTPEKL